MKTKHKLKRLSKTECLVYCPVAKRWVVVWISGWRGAELSGMGEHVHCKFCKEIIEI